jgi:hypothetical protein
MATAKCEFVWAVTFLMIPWRFEIRITTSTELSNAFGFQAHWYESWAPHRCVRSGSSVLFPVTSQQPVLSCKTCSVLLLDAASLSVEGIGELTALGCKPTLREITISMEHSLSSQAGSFSAGNISHILWNMKVHCCVYNWPPVVPLLSLINQSTTSHLIFRRVNKITKSV